MTQSRLVYQTQIWQEEPEANNPFAAKTSYCYGYDVHQQIVPNATWIESLFLLFKGERPSSKQQQLLEKMAIILSYTSMRDASVRAAMNSGVSGATHAATLMAALAVGAGQYGGSHEVNLAVQLWQRCGLEVNRWQDALLAYKNPKSAHHVTEIWLDVEHPIGFDPNCPECPTPVLQALTLLASLSDGQALPWLSEQRQTLEQTVNASLAMTGVMAAAFFDLGFTEHQAEMLFLILRLPSAAVFALEQQQQGWRKFPFFGEQIQLNNDCGQQGTTT